MRKQQQMSLFLDLINLMNTSRNNNRKDEKIFFIPFYMEACICGRCLKKLNLQSDKRVRGDSRRYTNDESAYA